MNEANTYTFLEALRVLMRYRGGAAVRRKNWRAVLLWRKEQTTVSMLWPSGFEHPWTPTPEDLVAQDWLVMVSGGVEE